MKIVTTLLLLLLTPTIFAQTPIRFGDAKIDQITFQSAKSASIEPLNGKVIVILSEPDPGSKVGLQIVINSKAKFHLVNVRNSSGKRVPVFQFTSNKNTWLMEGTKGTYSVEIQEFDPELGIGLTELDASIDSGPAPPPDPDPPQPPPDGLPIDGDGLRVLIVYESSDLTKYPEAQKSIIFSTEVRVYLNSKCPDENGTKEYRFWDQNVPLDYVSDRWKKAMGKPRTSLPWVAISNGKEGYAGPLPQSIPEMMTLLRKYGG